jgi:hypothetical protein
VYNFFSDGNEQNLFSLEKNTGILSLNKELDRESVAVHIFTVVVTNFPDGPQSQPDEKSKLQITVNVSI